MPFYDQLVRETAVQRAQLIEVPQLQAGLAGHIPRAAYIDYLTGDLNYRQRAKAEEEWATYAKEHPVGSSAFSVLESPLKGLSYLGQAADYLSDGEIDQNAGYNKFSYINSAIRNKPLPVYGDGKNVRDWLYVEDHCEALLGVFERGASGETYNVGGGAELTNLQLVETLTALMDEMHPAARSHRELITFVADRPGHDRRGRRR